MANELFKELKTRIALKVLTWSEWNEIKDTYRPLPGEVCFCEVPTGNNEATNAPTVLFKVGSTETNEDGSRKTFGQLKWSSALAADVHDWAKKSEEDFIVWMNGKYASATENGAKSIAQEALNKINTFLDSITPDGSDDIIDTLREINDYITEHGLDFGELEEKIDECLTKITTTENGGLKVSEKVKGVQNIDIDTDIVFVLDCNW